MGVEIRGVCPLLQVFDMPTSLGFYRDVLGFEIVNCAPPVGQVPPDAHGWAWLRHGTTEIMLNTLYDPEAPRPVAPDSARVVCHADTVLYFGCPDVDAMHEQLRRAGLALEPPRVAPYGMKQIYLRDPDGFALCFQWPAPGPDEDRPAR